MEQILEVKNLHVHYGMIHAIKGLDFHVNKGEIVTLIGANGAGKTSTLQTITGLIPHFQGEIIYRGENVSKFPRDLPMFRREEEFLPALRYTKISCWEPIPERTQRKLKKA